MLNRLKISHLIQFEAKVSAQELTYRAKHYHNIRALKDRQLVCGSCGNDVAAETGKIFSHPVVGILQCETCWEQLREINSVAENINLSKHCCLCGCTNNLYTCERKDCSFAFCRKCIKRNANLSLLDAETGDWKCFVCESKPFWELRAVCATVMSSITKRRQKSKWNESRKNEKNDKHGKVRLPSFTRQMPDKVQRLRKTMRTLCDDDTSSEEESRPSIVFDRRSEKYSSDHTDRNDLIKTKNYENRSSFSEPEIEKSERKEGRSTSRLGLESSSQKYMQQKSEKKMQRTLNVFRSEEAADSSSGKEFQKSKLSSDSYGCLKKLSNLKRDYTRSARVNKSDAPSSKNEGKMIISNEQNLRFKSNMYKVLKKFKEVCTEFELEMQQLQWKHFKKQLVYEEDAVNIVSKSRNVINRLKMELEVQEKELTTFYRSWSKNCSLADKEDAEEVRHLNKENEQVEGKAKEKGGEEETEDEEIIGPSDKEGKRSLDESIVSECDFEAIFSLGERTNKKLEINTYDKQNESVADMFEDGVNQIVNDTASEVSDLLEEDTNFNDSNHDFENSENLDNMESSNMTLDEDPITLNPTNRDKSKVTCENKALDTDKKREKSAGPETESESKSKSKSKSKLQRRGSIDEIDKHETTPSSFSEMLNAEEEAKLAMLMSDFEGDKSKDSTERCIDNIGEENNDRLEEQAVISKLEKHAMRILLESDSDDSGSDINLLERKQESDAKASLLVSFSESTSFSSNSSSENGSKTEIKLLAEERSKGVKRGYDSTDSDSVINRVKKKRSKLHEKLITDDDDKLRSYCKVVLQRLGEDVLKTHAHALEKSKQYLDCKEIQSLIDLERLEQTRRAKDASRSAKDSSKEKKRKKEAEDSLLDHLKRIENGESVVMEEHSNDSDENRFPQTLKTIQSTEELMLEADRAAKNMLLNTSDWDIGKEKKSETSNSDDDDDEKSENKASARAPKKTGEKSEAKSSGSDKDKDDEREKGRWRRNKILTMRLSSDSNSDVEREKWKTKEEKLRAEKEKENENEKNDLENSDSKEVSVIKRKKRNRRRVLNSDSDSTVAMEKENVSSDKNDSSTDGKRKTNDPAQAEKRSKPKRKRIRKMASDSDDDSDSDHVSSSQGTPGKMGRKNIRKVMKDKQVAEDTKQAAKEEDERIKRIAERQKVYNEMYEARLAGEERVEKLVLDFDIETKEELVSVHQELVKRLKPHQAKGIKFMWDACFESLERMKTSSGSGCIIAHCMGLGKTLQVIALIHTLLTHEQISINTILVVCPLSTVLNWVNEFNTWLKDIDNHEDIEVYELTKLKKNVERVYQLESWQRTGGVLLIGYEMFRNLCNVKKGLSKRMRESVQKYLMDPGPDMIVCDEGHLLKNEDTALSKCMKQIKTLRRIVLTGTPLQNNLTEYHCMVQFVKPNLLGTKKEFLNRFVNPITNGQFDDSTEGDVKLMKKRAYVLHKMLKGCVQRLDYSVLTPFLPPKQEYVIFVGLTQVQINLYRHYLTNFTRKHRGSGGSLFADFQALQRIWTHPLVIRLNAEKYERMNERKFASSDSEGSLKDFVVSNSSESVNSSDTSSDDEGEIVPDSRNEATDCSKSNRKNNSATNETDVEMEENVRDEEWWLQFVRPEHFEDMKISAKLILLFGILKECEQIGDKVLVFSQSLYSLTLIERFLDKIDDATQQGNSSEDIDGHTGSWTLGLDYFRLDGQTSAENRNFWCERFNKSSNSRARLFLISTRAGGLGINLTAANRVIIFDASWNPSHDVQSIFRVYRFGQKKPCYIYRFLAAGTMEEKIYNRQVTKLSLSCRVVDEQQIERHYSNNDLNELYKFEPNMSGEKATLNLPKDRLLAEIFLKYKDCVENYHEHDSLLENKAEEELNEEERKQAWLEYEEEKKGRPFQPQVTMPSFQMATNMILNQFGMPTPINVSDYQKLEELIRKDYPNVSPEYQKAMTTRAFSEMYNYWEQQTILDSSANHIMAQQAATLITPQMPAMPSMPRDTRMPMILRAQQNLKKNVRSQLVPNPFVSRTVETTGDSGAAAAAAAAGAVAAAADDDDVVEVPTTATTSSTNQSSHQLGNKNKNEEE